MTKAQAQKPSRADVEDFLYYEAALLDAWKLDEWFALFTEDCVYEVPSSGGTLESSPTTELFYIADDYVRLRERIERLKTNDAHAEYPRSIQQHVVSNVRLIKASEDHVGVECNFLTHRTKNGVVNTFFGQSRYLLCSASNGFKIRAKRNVLAMDILYAGKVSILL